MKLSLKKFLCGILSLLLVVSLIPTNFTLVVSASTVDTEDTTLEVYEVSYLNCIGVNGTPFTENHVNDRSLGSKLNVLTGSTIEPSTTWYSLDGQYCITAQTSANTVEIESFSYQGKELTVDYNIPDFIEFHYVDELNEVTDEAGEFVYYDVKTARTSGIVTSISDAFNVDNANQSTCTSISLTVPKRVTTIDENAFYNNTKLTSINFEGDIQSIGASAFEGCTRLKTLDLAGVFETVATNTIPDRCFYKCSSLENIAIPETILNIGQEAFYQCDKIDYLILSKSIKTVGDNAFAMCSNLRYLYIESTYSDWTNVVDETEQYKLVNNAKGESPIVAVADATTPVQSYIFGACEMVVSSKVDMDASTVEVKKDGVAYPTKAVTSSIYGYNTNAVGFTIPQSGKGVYTVTGKDILGNAVEYSFSYLSDVADTTPPVVEINGVGNNNNYQRVSISYKDNETYIHAVEFDGNILPATGYLECATDGQHTLIVKDVFGNTTTKTFTIDGTAPVISGVENDKAYNEEKEVQISDSGCGIKEVTVNGSPVPVADSFTFQNTGTYTITVTDNALNTTTCKFIIDTTGPSLSGVASETVYSRDVQCNVVSGLGIKSINVNCKAADGVVSNYTINSGDVLKLDGDYTVTLEDLLGNTVTYTFTIDKTAPVVNGITNGAYYKTSVSGTIADANINSCVLNGQEVGQEFSVEDEGTYVLNAADKCGNTTTVNFVVDKTAPTVNVKNNAVYKKAITLTVSDKISGVASITLDGKTVKNKTKVSKDGTHKVVVTDKCGNKKTYTFKVDKTKPTCSIANKATVKKGTKIKVADKTSGIKSITLNNKKIKNNYKLTKKGKYTLVITDKAGNKRTVKFTVK